MHVFASVTSISTLLQAVFAGGLLVVATAAAWFAYGQLKLQTAVAKRERVYALVDRISDLEFVKMMNDALALMRVGVARGAVLWKAPESVDTMLKVVAFLNFFEEVAGEYLDDLLDKPVANENVAYVAVTVWNEALEFVTWFRETAPEPLAWKRLQDLADLGLEASNAPAAADARSQLDQLIRANAPRRRA